MFVEFFCEKYLLAMDKYIMVIPRPPALCAGEAPDKKLNINDLGPYMLILKVSSTVLVKFPITVDETKDARMPAPATIGLIIAVIVTTSLRG